MAGHAPHSSSTKSTFPPLTQRSGYVGEPLENAPFLNAKSQAQSKMASCVTTVKRLGVTSASTSRNVTKKQKATMVASAAGKSNKKAEEAIQMIKAQEANKKKNSAPKT